nr:ribonuclease H-like domain, reverse transcriptase, RNA-dependent DNA polymerase [Tanacetum cinerariifolium]
CKEKGGNDKQRYSSFKIKEIRKKEEDLKALITVDTLVDWTDHDSKSDGVITAKEFGMIAGCDSEDAIEEGTAKIYNLITRADTEEASTADDVGEFALMGVTFELHNCPFGCENKYNELHKQYNELNEQNGEYFIQVQAYKNSLETLEKQKRVLQRNQLTLENKIMVLFIELENTSNLLKHSERINADVEIAKKELQTKLDNHLVQTEKWRNSSKNLFRLIDSSMSVRTKVGFGFNDCIRANELGWDDSAFSVFTTNFEDVEDYTSLSDHSDLDESQMSYGTKSSNSCDSKSVSNDFVSCDDSEKSSKSLNEMILPHVHQLLVGTHLIKDCDFYEKQMVNKTVGIGVGPVRNRNKVNHPNQFVSQAVLLRTCKVTIPLARPQLVPTGHVRNRNKVNHPNQFVSQAVLLRTCKVTIPLARPQLVPTEKVYTGYPRTIVDLIHLHTDDNVADLLTKAFDGPSASVSRVPTGSFVPTG